MDMEQTKSQETTSEGNSSSSDSMLGGMDSQPANAEQAGEQGQNAVAQQAPETYEAFSVPDDIDNVVIDEASAKEYGELARELNLTQEQAQKVVEFGVRKMHKAIRDTDESMTAKMEELKAKWHKESESDSSLMGNMEYAKRTMSRFMDEDLKTLFNDTGIGSHKAMIRFAIEVGKAIGEAPLYTQGRLAVGSSIDLSDQRTIANSMYANKM